MFRRGRNREEAVFPSEGIKLNKAIAYPLNVGQSRITDRGPVPLTMIPISYVVSIVYAEKLGEIFAQSHYIAVNPYGLPIYDLGPQTL